MLSITQHYLVKIPEGNGYTGPLFVERWKVSEYNFITLSIT